MAASIALIQPVLTAAQTSSAPPSASPPASAASAPPAVSAPFRANASGYRSAFEGYHAYGDQPVGSWREANDTVRQIGGWQAYAREAQGMGDASGAAPAGRMPAAHGGMQMSGSTGTPAPLSPAASSPGPAPAVEVPAGQAAGRPASRASSSHSKHH